MCAKLVHIMYNNYVHLRPLKNLILVFEFGIQLLSLLIAHNIKICIQTINEDVLQMYILGYHRNVLEDTTKQALS